MLQKKYKIIAVICLLFLSGMLGLIVSFNVHKVEKLPADVTVIQTFHYPALFAEQLKGDKDAGQKVFKQFCTSCHGAEPIIDVHAPRVNDPTAWKPRRALGIELLLKITTQGVGAMPARGGCFECSDEELRQAVQYMLDQSQGRRK